MPPKVPNDPSLPAAVQQSRSGIGFGKRLYKGFGAPPRFGLGTSKTALIAMIYSEFKDVVYEDAVFHNDSFVFRMWCLETGEGYKVYYSGTPHPRTPHP